MERFISWGVRRYIGGPGRSWVFATVALLGYRLVRSVVGRRPVSHVAPVAKGEKVVIEHLPVTHGEQIKAERSQARAEKAERRLARKQARASKR